MISKGCKSDLLQKSKPKQHDILKGAAYRVQKLTVSDIDARVTIIQTSAKPRVFLEIWICSEPVVLSIKHETKSHEPGEVLRQYQKHEKEHKN